MAKETIDSTTPAYLPFETFTGFLDRFETTPVPPRIDNSLLSSYSGTSRSQLMTALRFFNLITSNGVVQAGLKNLVEARNDPEIWKASVSDHILDAYLPIVRDLDLDKATSGQLEEAFRDRANISGSVLKKAIRFYLKALDEAGLTYSPHFTRIRAAPTSPAQQNGGAGKKAKRRKSIRQSDDGDEHESRSGDGMLVFPIHFPGKPAGVIKVPKDINTQDLGMLKAMVTAVETYAKQQVENGGDG
jgi:hypothetical protein